MKKLIFLFFILGEILSAQTYTVTVKGYAKTQTGLSESWESLKSGSVLSPATTVVAEENSVIQLKNYNTKCTLKGPAALTLSDIKKISIDDLLLGLAMDDMINAPKSKEELKSKNTAVYGTEENGKTLKKNISSNIGLLRLNGSKQLAENGYEESAILTSKITYRKYPELKNLPSYRIYFANLLSQLKLNEEAYNEYISIRNLELNPSDKIEVNSRIEELSKKLVKK